MGEKSHITSVFAQERWFERDAEYMRSTPIRAAAKQKSGSKVEITVNATGRQSMSPPSSPEKQGKVSNVFHSLCHSRLVLGSTPVSTVTRKFDPIISGQYN